MPTLPAAPLMVPECVIRARSPCAAIPALELPMLSSPMLVTRASLPNTSMAAPEPVTLIVPALLTMARLPCSRMPSVFNPAVMVAPARLLTVLSSLMPTMAPDRADAWPTVMAPELVTVLLPAAEIATPSLPRVMTPEAALTIVLLTPAKMPKLGAPGGTAIVPLLVTVLKSLTLMAVPMPPSLAVAPGSTLTVRLFAPPPAWKPAGELPLQVTVWPLDAGSGAQAAFAGAADRLRPTKNADMATARTAASRRRRPCANGSD